MNQHRHALVSALAIGILVTAEIPAFIWMLMTTFAAWLDPDVIDDFDDSDDEDFDDYDDYEW